MLYLPISDVDFAAIERFCKEEREEGLDLDYKSDWESDLANVLCAMANVQGGIVLIGVEEDPVTRKPKWPPVGVAGTKDELNQRSVQIAHDAVCPPIMPEVTVVTLAADPSRSVVVIRVEASRLLHATDGRRRVYVKVADHKRGYERANLSQLERLFQQREKSVNLRDQILERASQHARLLMKGRRPTGKDLIQDKGPTPTLVIYATPYSPNQILEKDLVELFQIANQIGQKVAGWPGGSGHVPLE